VVGRGLQDDTQFSLCFGKLVFADERRRTLNSSGRIVVLGGCARRVKENAHGKQWQESDGRKMPSRPTNVAQAGILGGAIKLPFTPRSGGEYEFEHSSGHLPPRFLKSFCSMRPRPSFIVRILFTPAPAILSTTPLGQRTSIKSIFVRFSRP